MVLGGVEKGLKIMIYNNHSFIFLNHSLKTLWNFISKTCFMLATAIAF